MSAEEPDRGEHMEVTEKAVLELCHKQLGVPLTSANVSIAHRLRKKSNASGPPAVIVRFRLLIEKPARQCTLPATS